MNVKVLSAIGISGLLMAGGVWSASASSTSGYDIFKTSVKNMHNVESFTADVQASLSDNGNEIFQVSSVSKQDIKGDASSGSVNINNGSVAKKVDFYSNDHQKIVKTSDDANYYVEQDHEARAGGESDNQKEDQLSPQMQKDIEGIFDAFTKNYQDSITSNKLANGNTELQLNLSKNQIPATAQAAVSFLVKNMDQKGQDIEKEGFGSLQFAKLTPQLPKLEKNITISKVELLGEVNADEYLVGQEATIYVTGDDANGTSHNLVLHLNSKLDQLNATNVDHVDLSGKQVVTVQDNHHRHED